MNNIFSALQPKALYEPLDNSQIGGVHRVPAGSSARNISQRRANLVSARTETHEICMDDHLSLFVWGSVSAVRRASVRPQNEWLMDVVGQMITRLGHAQQVNVGACASRKGSRIGWLRGRTENRK